MGKIMEQQTIAKIGERITTQDNRITDQPIFVVEKSVTVITDPDYGYDVEVWVNHDDYNEEASETKARRLDILNSNFRWFRNWRKFYLKETWEFVTACFTEQGCKDYLKADGHNLGKTRIYAYGSYRNEEYQTVRNHLAGLASAEICTKKYYWVLFTLKRIIYRNNTIVAKEESYYQEVIEGIHPVVYISEENHKYEPDHYRDEFSKRFGEKQSESRTLLNWKELSKDEFLALKDEI